MSAPPHAPPCVRCDSPLERGDLRCPICGLRTPEAAPAPGGPGSPGERPRAVVLRCDDCGAATAYDAAAGAPACAFCGALQRAEELTDPPEVTEAWLPFLVSRREAEAALRDWLGSRGFLRPPDLARRARVESLRPVHWVGWACDARAEVTWSADSDADSWRSSWAPHAGSTSMVFDDLLLSASRGLADGEVAAIVGGYTLDRLEAAPSPPEGAASEDLVVESFDVQRSAARRRIVSAIHATAAGRLTHGTIPGRRYRNVHASALLEGLDTRRLGFPAWVLAYRYDERVFRCVISGQDATLATGTSPVSWRRVLLLAAGILAVVLLVLAVVLGAAA